MAKILVVDDDQDILSVMEILLSMKGFVVDVISRGDMTFQKLESFQPDLILLDVLISGQDGRTICKEIKASDKFRHLPILMLSAHPGAAATIMDYGADGFIAKPFDVENLLSKIREQLDKHVKPVEK